MVFKVRQQNRRRWRLVLQAGRHVVVGRNPNSCQLVLKNRGVSREHCALSVRGAWGWVEDLGSSNGTYVNGQRVECSPLGPGDVVTIGDCWIAVN